MSVCQEDAACCDMWLYKMKILICLVVLTGLQIPCAFADSMRCGSKLVADGDTKFEVLVKCGEPEFVDVISGYYARKIEIWNYRLGPNEFVRTLTFRGDRLKKIEIEGFR